MNSLHELCIQNIEISRTCQNKKTRISFTIKFENIDRILWFEFDREWERYLSADRCDAAVVCIFYYAVRFGYNIRLECPISESLYYQLQYQLIPQLHAADQKFHKITIFPNKLSRKYRICKNAVGMGMSLGVDSFATLYEYNYSDLKKYNHYTITHFTYHQVGAHHGLSRGKQGPNTPAQLFEDDLKKVRDFCSKYHYPLIVIISNLDELLKESFPFLPFWASYSFRNTGTVLLFQKLFCKFYLSAGFNLNEFHCGTVWDSGRYDPLTLPLISTENTHFYRSNQDWTRIKKIELLSEFEPSYDYLTVCMTHSKNCGICEKCKPTLLAMDILGVLERYSGSFDLALYKKEYRTQWLEDLWTDSQKSTFIREVLDYALKNDFPDLPQPKLTHVEQEMIFGSVNNVNLRKFPSSHAKLLRQNLSEKIRILGSFHDWYYVETLSGQRGYCYSEYVRRPPND